MNHHGSPVCNLKSCILCPHGMFPNLLMVHVVIKNCHKYFYMKTMIPHEHDHSVVSQSCLLNGTQHSAHLVIHEADGGVVCPPELPCLRSTASHCTVIVRSHLGVGEGDVDLAEVRDAETLGGAVRVVEEAGGAGPAREGHVLGHVPGSAWVQGSAWSLLSLVEGQVHLLLGVQVEELLGSVPRHVGLVETQSEEERFLPSQSLA